MADPPPLPPPPRALPAPNHKIVHTASRLGPPAPQQLSTNSLKAFVVSVQAVRISIKAGGKLVSLKRCNGSALQGATAGRPHHLQPAAAFSLRRGKSASVA